MAYYAVLAKRVPDGRRGCLLGLQFEERKKSMPLDLRKVVRLSLLVPFSVLFATLALTIGLAQAGVCTSEVPMGAIAPARPIWCEVLGAGKDTHTGGANSGRMTSTMVNPWRS